MNLLAAISKSVAVEFKKSRHKHSFLLLAIAVLLNYFYLFHGNTPDRQAWYNVFFAIPMINTLILSVLMAVLASQSVDMEHKGNISRQAPLRVHTLDLVLLTTDGNGDSDGGQARI